MSILKQGHTLGFRSGRALQTFAPLLAVAQVCGNDIFERVHKACKLIEKQWSGTGIDLGAVTLSVLADALRDSMSRVMRVKVSSGEVYIDVSELAREVTRVVAEMTGQKTKVTAAEIEHYVRSILPPDSYKVEIIGWRKAIVLSRDYCRTEAECRKKLLEAIESIKSI